MIPRQELRDYPAPLTAVRSSNDSTICDSTRDQHLKETFLEVPTALLCLDPMGMRPFPKLISPERVLQVKDFEVSRDNRKENKKQRLISSRCRHSWGVSVWRWVSDWFHRATWGSSKYQHLTLSSKVGNPRGMKTKWEDGRPSLGFV